MKAIEERLKALNLPPDEEEKRRRLMYKTLGLEMSGFISSDIELPEGAILIGVCNGELCQAKAAGGKLWVGDESFTAISAAAIKASGRPTMSGWEFWRLVYIPRKGFMEVSELRITEQRKNKKR